VEQITTAMMEHKFIINGTNHDYKGNKILSCETNKDYMGNKNLDCGTSHDCNDGTQIYR
jgi:hypothetical protein